MLHMPETQPALNKCSRGFFLLCFRGHLAFCSVLLGCLLLLPPIFLHTGTLVPATVISSLSTMTAVFMSPQLHEDGLKIQSPTPSHPSSLHRTAEPENWTGALPVDLGGTAAEARLQEGRSLLPGEKVATIYPSNQEMDMLSLNGRMQTE